MLRAFPVLERTMSFSSRVIAEPVPPVSALIKHLGLIIWVLPILLSLFVLLISPRTGSPARGLMVNEQMRESLNAVVAELPDLLEPETFARIGATPYARTALNLPVAGERKFPMKAEAWKASAIYAGGKIAMKADDAGPISQASQMQSGPQTPLVSDLRLASRSSKIAFAEPRTFKRVKVIGATSIVADNLKVILAGVEPLPDHVMCKRIDGVMQSCNERAEHRLAILLQARSISCELSDPLESGAYIGRCTADRIDLASDLLRQKLAQRNAMTLASASR